MRNPILQIQGDRIMSVTAIIAAGGKGARMGAGENKVFMNLRGKEMLVHTVSAFEKNPDIDEIIIVTGEHEHMRVGELMQKNGITKLRIATTGGATRTESVKNGLAFASGDIILIHDGARALISQEEISAAVKAAEEYGAAAVGVPCKDTLKSVEDGFITGTVDRAKTYMIQTPQAFRRDVILSAYKRAENKKITVTDDCALVERCGGRIKIVEGKYENIKLTTPDDIAVAERILEKRENE